jgi:hypothetical protein
VPGPSSIAGLSEQPVLVSSQLDRGSEPRSPPEYAPFVAGMQAAYAQGRTRGEEAQHDEKS